MVARTRRARVTGIGGIFFKAKNPKALVQWYRRHLGIAIEDSVALFTRRGDKEGKVRGQHGLVDLPRRHEVLRRGRRVVHDQRRTLLPHAIGSLSRRRAGQGRTRLNAPHSQVNSADRVQIPHFRRCLSASSANSRTISPAFWMRFTPSTDSPAQSGIASNVPVVVLSATNESRACTGTRTSGAHGWAVSPTNSPWNRSTASTQERKTRWGAFGQFAENASVTIVSFASAAMSLSTYAGWVPASSAATNRVPTRTAEAPAARAAAMARPVPIPPAATTGTLTDGRTSPRSARRPIFPRTWPPASVPWATIRSQPARSAASASGPEPTCQETRAPPAWAISTSSTSGFS